MIATRFLGRASPPWSADDEKGRSRVMDSLTAGTFVGAGSFRCSRCGYVQTLVGSDTLSDCPGCGGRSFLRASLFSAQPMTTDRWTEPASSTLAEPPNAEREKLLAEARDSIE